MHPTSKTKSHTASLTGLRIRKPWHAVSEMVSRRLQQSTSQLESMKLNYDVLHLLMQYLPRRELLRMMHTCSALYELGMLMMLNNVAYDRLSGGIRLFRHLLLSNPSRFLLVKSLRCRYEESSNLLTDFIHLSTRLQSLDIRMGRGMELKPDTLAEIALLPDLRHLKLRGPIPSLELLRILTVPLKSLEIDRFSFPNFIDLGNYILHNPFASIQRFRDSLESFSFVLHATSDTPAVFAAGYCFPAVRRLKWYSWHPIDMHILASTFPNLESLSVGFDGLGGNPRRVSIIPPLSTAQIAEYRQRNHTVPQWDASHRLKYLEGSVLSLSTLGIRCTAELLDITLTPQNIPNPVVQELLADIRPERIRVTSRVDGFSNSLWSIQGRALIYETVRELEIAYSVIEFELLNAAARLMGFLKRANWGPLEHPERCRIQRLAIRLELLMEDHREHRLWAHQYSQVQWDLFPGIAFGVIPSLQEVAISFSYYPTIVRRRADILS